MKKDDFLDIVFASAWISVFISAIITAGIYLIFKNANLFALAILVEAVVMYLTCRYLYSRKFGD